MRGWRRRLRNTARRPRRGPATSSSPRATETSRRSPCCRRRAITAGRHAPRSGARWFEAALRLLPSDAAPADRLALLAALAGAWAATGRFEESHSTLLEAIELVAEDDVAARVPLIARCAAVEQRLGRHDQARRRLLAALDALQDRSSAQAVELMLALVSDALYRGAFEDMRGSSAGGAALRGRPR